MFLHNVWVCLFHPMTGGKREEEGGEMHEEANEAHQENQERRMRGNEIGGRRDMQGRMRGRETHEMCMAVKE